MFTKKTVIFALVLAVVGIAVFWLLSQPRVLQQKDLPTYTANLANGKIMYDAGGCISCHKPARGAKNQNLPLGGSAFATPLGVFYPPNITADKATGIGNWSDLDFVNALKRGVSPTGRHYIPAFPYTSYANMAVSDILDLKAYLFSLQKVNTAGARQTDIFALPVLRRGIGLWKWIGLKGGGFVADKSKSEQWNRGAYLVAGPGHCNECHTPRTIFMANDFSRRLAGGPHPEGKGKVPSLRNLKARKKFTDADDLNSALRFGEIMGYEDISSGGMGDVQTNMSKLPEAETKAIAVYLMSLGAK